jgi:5-amino-6-(5-phosphoribosylamino)uracil reductase
VQIADWRGRFLAFAARKEADASTAVMSPFTTVVDHAVGQFSSIGNAWSRRLFDGPFHLSSASSADLPAASLVFVQSHDGNTGARNPSTLGGGQADLHLIYEGLSRVAADAVLAGAGTARGSHFVLSTWHPELVRLRAALDLPRHPVQIVATLRGLAIDDGLMFNLPDVRVMLLTLPTAADQMRQALAARPWITPLVMNDPHDLPQAFRQLGEQGIRRVSCIGGRGVAGQLIDAGLIQDLYLTTSAKAGGEPNTPLYSRPLEGREVVRKLGTGLDTGVVFQHLVIV